MILTASHYVYRKEIGSRLDEKVAQLCVDLGGGFNSLSLPEAGGCLAQYQDRAHQEIEHIFCTAIQKHRLKNKIDDIL